ncbi:hypothetical protein LY78DRAFT_686128 [Colletotrichum sublineola]|nr:hypothetical protein LY78DRAFT_686128 [Colletotrichum sublineola]
MSANNDDQQQQQQQQQQRQQRQLRPRAPPPAAPNFGQSFPYTATPTSSSVRQYVNQTVVPAQSVNPVSASRASAILLTNLEGEARLLGRELRAAAVIDPADVKAATNLRKLANLWPNGAWCPPGFLPPGNLPGSILSEMRTLSSHVARNRGSQWLPQLWNPAPGPHPLGVLHAAMRGKVFLTREVIRNACKD